MKLKVCFSLLMMLSCCSIWATDYGRYYQNLPTPLTQVTPFTIPSNEVSLAECGGVGDGVTLNTEAFSKAISKLNKQGGGRLVVPTTAS